MHTSLYLVFPSNTDLIYVTLPTYVLAMDLRQKGRLSELNILPGVAQNNGFTQHVIQRLYGNITQKQRYIQIPRLLQKIKKWLTFTYYSLAITKVRFTNSPEHSSQIT
jgi:hypothetical protein